MAHTVGVIVFDDGHTRYLDSDLYTSPIPFGNNLLTELDFRFDQLDDGLYLEISHHAPDDADAKKTLGEATTDQTDERGAKCYLIHDAYLQILTCEEMEHVLRITINGEDMLVRWRGVLIPIHHIRELSKIYLSDREDQSLTRTITELAKVLDREMKNEDDDIIVAEKLGITSDILNHALIVAGMQGQEDYQRVDDEQDSM